RRSGNTKAASMRPAMIVTIDRFTAKLLVRRHQRKDRPMIELLPEFRNYCGWHACPWGCASAQTRLRRLTPAKLSLLHRPQARSDPAGRAAQKTTFVSHVPAYCMRPAASVKLRKSKESRNSGKLRHRGNLNE